MNLDERVLIEMTVSEMRQYLSDEFGIKNDNELEKALNRIGGIKIGIFTERYERKTN